MKNHKADTDTAYCINTVCKNKCWRHIKNWDFDANKNYCFTSGMEDCEVVDG